MKFELKKLQKINFNTDFSIEKTNLSTIISFSELMLEDQKFENVKMVCKNPVNEWASVWIEKNKKWEDVNDSNFSIIEKITAFNVKEAGQCLSLSFGGEHKKGFARWGFSTAEIEFNF